MKTLIAIYDTHADAVNALSALKENHFSMKDVSLLGKAEVIEDHLHIRSFDKAENTPVLLGTGGGVIAGLLTGIGVFAVPGFGFLYGAGAVIGAIAGFDIGLVAGGIGSLMTTLGLEEKHTKKVKEHLEKGKYSVLVKGSEDDILKAEKVLEEEGSHFEILH